MVADMKPDVLIMASAENTLQRLASGAEGEAAAAEYEAGMRRGLEDLKPSAASVVVLSKPPMGQNLQTCVTKVSKPADCATTVTNEWRAFTGSERTATGARYVDTQLWVCNTSGRCPAFVGATPIRVDSGHLTIQYAESLAHVMRTTLLAG
ncbi:hypothetical protein GU243_10910 [Pseudarthrobacter psychrotolerans]|uniref:SGNH domain-containing protein n=1 Tax=Pseudarthrobacter psychrotolerans TaxID=2697569 RepID=A0A6P1NKP8_9MICC|nr:hypothetical protein GU243_10910 [Pseudarthrobacter psychrotolerans]